MVGVRRGIEKVKMKSRKENRVWITENEHKPNPNEYWPGPEKANHSLLYSLKIK